MFIMEISETVRDTGMVLFHKTPQFSFLKNTISAGVDLEI